MQLLSKKHPEEITVGLPRAFLYYRYGGMWKIFFKELGVKTVTSPFTNRQLLESGSYLSVDESCLSAKVFLGHVNDLLFKCDYILIPRVFSLGVRRVMCTRFQSLYDLVLNTFPEKKEKFLPWNLDPVHGYDELHAYETVGEKLGFGRKECKKAYQKARKAEEELIRSDIKKQNSLLKKEGRKLLIVGHPYVLEDAYIGKRILDYLNGLGITIIRADIVDREEALKRSQGVSPTLKWEMNRELVGGIEKYREAVDGILLVSVYPCGPDSLVNEMIIRKYTEIPILQLVLDEQDGFAGLETRIESFLDIIDFKEEGSKWIEKK